MFIPLELIQQGQNVMLTQGKQEAIPISVLLLLMLLVIHLRHPWRLWDVTTTAAAAPVSSIATTTTLAALVGVSVQGD